MTFHRFSYLTLLQGLQNPQYLSDLVLNRNCGFMNSEDLDNMVMEYINQSRGDFEENISAGWLIYLLYNKTILFQIETYEGKVTRFLVTSKDKNHIQKWHEHIYPVKRLIGQIILIFDIDVFGTNPHSLILTHAKDML